MGLLDIFLKPKPQSKASFSRICYDMAYTALPHLAFHDCDRLVQMFTDGPIPPGTFCYVTVCQALKIQIIREDAKRFREHFGKLDDARDYFVLEYPTPPPVALPPGQAPVLAPYFSAVVRHRQTGVVNYFTLGQTPGGGTTLRAVTPDDTNLNLGPGPEPQLDAFLDQLRTSRS